MKDLLSIFSWIASNLIEYLCPGGFITDTIQEELKQYHESAITLADDMAEAWKESILILEASLGGGRWLSPLYRKQIAERFKNEIIIPFAKKNNLNDEELTKYKALALAQCRQLKKIGADIINFKSMKEDVLLNALVDCPIKGIDREDMGVMIIDLVQSKLPNAKELLALLWYRNILLEGLVVQFHFILSKNSQLAAVVNRMDHQQVRSDLLYVKEKIQNLLQEGNFVESGKLGSRLSHLATADEIWKLQEDYTNLFGEAINHFQHLEQDHQEINEKLDKALHLLEQLQHLHGGHSQQWKITMSPEMNRPSLQEKKLVDELNTLVSNLGWQQLPERKRDLVANSMAVTLYCSEKISQALSILEDAIAQGVHSAEVYFNYFQALQANKMNDKAVKIYNEAIEMNPDLALFPPDKYTMTGILGRGGMGVVYKAIDLKTKEDVAIKVLLLPENWYPGAKKRFVQANKMAINLRHPNIVRVYALYNETEAAPCMVMEYLQGKDLYNTIKEKGCFSIKQSLDIAYQVALGLQYAHEKGVIHRDLKPGNIILLERGPVIIDFGLAKCEKNSTLTHNGEMFYTLYYSSPEQRLDFHNVDVRSDIYSFGKTLYFLFVGEDPYDIDWNDLPLLIRPLIQKATRKKLENRYQSMKEVIADLQEIMKNAETDTSIVESVKTNATTPPAEVNYKTKKYWIDLFKADWNISEQGDITYLRDNAEMIYIPNGEFTMGLNDPRCNYDETPAHVVYLDDYLIDKYPVTNQQYAKFLNAMGDLDVHPTPWCHPDEPREKTHIPQFWYRDEWTQDNYPVVGVDWWDAYAYTKWAAKDLPTEAEWEKAARGLDERIYPWGNNLPTVELCNCNLRYSHTTAVDKFKGGRSYYGCYDMAGNVWEWCFDWFDGHYYEISPRSNPRGPSIGRFRVARGGSWINDLYKVRTTIRAHGNSPSEHNPRLGFRTVKRVPPGLIPNLHN